jgi:hypothetical protein
VYAQTQKKEADLVQYYEQDGHRYQLHTIWEHEYKMSPLLHRYDLNILSDIMGDRDMFFGGHVNVFQPLVRANLEAEEHVRYIDITSHYPNICANYTLCMGHPTRLLGPEIDVRRLDPAHPDSYFGYFQGIVHMPKDDMYGGLPYRDTQKSVIFNNTSRLSCGFLPELYERLENGATLGQVYEVLHFPPSERWTGPFQGYVAYNYRDKMEASGWKSTLWARRRSSSKYS